jgi:hypothetical protein
MPAPEERRRSAGGPVVAAAEPGAHGKAADGDDQNEDAHLQRRKLRLVGAEEHQVGPDHGVGNPQQQDADQ